MGFLKCFVNLMAYLVVPFIFIGLLSVVAQFSYTEAIHSFPFWFIYALIWFPGTLIAMVDKTTVRLWK